MVYFIRIHKKNQSFIKIKRFEGDSENLRTTISWRFIKVEGVAWIIRHVIAGWVNNDWRDAQIRLIVFKKLKRKVSITK